MNETLEQARDQIIATAMEMGTETAVQAAERRRKERTRAIVTEVAKIPDKAEFEKFLADAEERFRKTYAKRCAEIIDTTEPKESEHSQRAQSFLDAMECPKRHLRRLPHQLDMTGDWGTKLAQVQSMIGNGFMAALIGTYGNGKTQFAVEVLRATAYRLKTGWFTSATQFFMDVKASYKLKESDAEKDVIERYCRPSVLVIDEMSKRGETEWENRLLFHVVNERYNDGDKDTLLIANQDETQFTESVGPAMVRRLSETGGMIECNWKAFV